jgi:ABC-type glycerol-3-phosphate transport system substrate-binding protein
MKMSTFQLLALVLFGFFILLGVGVFAAFGGLLGSTSVGPVTIWGTLDSNTINNMLATLHASDKTFAAVKYVQKDAAIYDATLVNAMASGQGPDLFLVPQDDVSSFANKITPIPYASMSQAQFISSYIDEGQIFLTANGALALPFTIDPLVMYWNRDLFAGAGLAQPPQYWSDFLTIAPKLTSLDASNNVHQSAVALGTYKNVDHAKQILSALFMQAGDPIVMHDSNGNLLPVFGQAPVNAPTNPAESALRFYTEFANPGKTTYSWNNALPDSATSFVNGNVGAYFGFASEYATIAARNPNLSFAVATLPQLEGNTTHLTFGEMTGVAISRTAANPAGALLVAEHLTGQKAVSLLAQQLLLPPVRRDVVIDTSSNAAAAVFVQSSLIARAWLDPSPSATNTVFQNMVNEVLSGAAEPASAIAEASQALARVFSGQSQTTQTTSL